ncbi:hypothetical protein I3843_08G118400 [Carya illinoinensis]|uniref:Late embryogenesis abundant protein LEA-2 subgroup domain-containing protein n=1 Tax=Carya illinoinensis TaxID=32201 RepID=A0A922ECH4_CARIL|nr:hypothetical protein I3842_08G123200 [Carya illinoinensis]KAG7967822.1 hypothetical protein I3843_08G118400 [Carya illinoinensis]
MRGGGNTDRGGSVSVPRLRWGWGYGPGPPAPALTVRGTPPRLCGGGANGAGQRVPGPRCPPLLVSKPTIILLFSFLALLILAVVLIIILAVKPKKPSFDLQQVGVQYMGINMPTLSTASAPETNPSTNPTTSAYLSLNIRMLFTAVNPNRVGIKYGESRFTVMYRGIPLGKASVPGFFQEAHSVRKVEATIAVDRVNLLQADAADLVRDASLNDRVELRVLGDVGAKIRVLNFDSPGVQHEASPENNTSSTFGFFQIINHGFRAGFEVGEGLGWNSRRVQLQKSSDEQKDPVVINLSTWIKSTVSWMYKCELFFRYTQEDHCNS